MTTRDTRSQRRRTVVALAVVLAVLAGFIVRLVDIQVVNADEHIDDSMQAFGASSTLYGARGQIVDDQGNTLAGSVIEYDCQLDPLLITQIDAEIADKKDTAAPSTATPWWEASPKIATILGNSKEDVQSIVADVLAENPDSRYASLVKGVSTETYRALMDLDYPYIACLQHPARSYPDGAVGGNLVGFVGVDGDGLGGLEKTQAQCLAATNGSVTFEKGKDGVTIPGSESRTPAVDGGTLELTIDRDLQWYMQQLIAEQAQSMRAKSGSIMVYEVETGKIRAAADWPTVDPNNVDASPIEDRASRIFTHTFEPGSTIKALTAATLLEAGGQTPASTVTASGLEKFSNGARVRDSFAHEKFNYTLAGVLMDSSNVGISKFSERISLQTRFDYLKKFGIGDGTAVDFLGEESGLIHPVDQWDNQMLYDTAYGQGLTSTLPEIVSAYGAIANDGVKLPMQLVESCTQADGTVIEPELPAATQAIKANTAEQVREMLENVALQGGNADNVEIPGYRVGIKTGTAQNVDESGNYKNGVYFTTMIGMAPVEDPKYIVAVTLDEPKKITSSAANASAWQKAMTQVLKNYRVLPSTTKATLLPKFGE